MTPCPTARPNANDEEAATMNSTHSLQVEIAQAICIWAVLVAALVINATWKKRRLPQVQEQPPTGLAVEWVPRIPETGVATTYIATPANEVANAAGNGQSRMEGVMAMARSPTQGTERRLPALNGNSRAKERADLERNKTCSIEGTLQRVNYREKTLWLVAAEDVWEFTADSRSQLWFDDEPAVLRCFHPLDQVRIVFLDNNSTKVIKTLVAHEKQCA
jgi:hypothetical protein